MTGTITKLCGSYGFIEPFGKGDAVFFHKDKLAPELEWGDQLQYRRVEFEVSKDFTSGKYRADFVRPIRDVERGDG